MKLKAEKIELSENVEELTPELAASSSKLNITQTRITLLNKFVSMLTKGKNNLEGLLKSKKKSHDKAKIGYEKQESSGKNPFVLEISQSST